MYDHRSKIDLSPAPALFGNARIVFTKLSQLHVNRFFRSLLFLARIRTRSHDEKLSISDTRESQVILNWRKNALALIAFFSVLTESSLESIKDICERLFALIKIYKLQREFIHTHVFITKFVIESELLTTTIIIPHSILIINLNRLFRIRALTILQRSAQDCLRNPISCASALRPAKLIS